jgi:hypothetical protein
MGLGVMTHVQHNGHRVAVQHEIDRVYVQRKSLRCACVPRAADA